MSQKNNLSDFNYGMDAIAEILKANGLDARKLRRKFKETLSTLGFQEEDIAIFKSTDKGQGQYTFTGEGATVIAQIFEQLFAMDYDLITKEECNLIIEKLKEIRPICKNVKQFQLLQAEAEKTKEKEDERLKDVILDENREAERKISEIVNNFYNRKRSVEVFEKKLFVDVPEFISNQNGKYEFFRYQSECIKEWGEKWESIMESIRTLRMAERFDIGYEWLMIQNRALERKSRQESEKQLKEFCASGKGEENLREAYNNKKMSSRNVYRFAIHKYERRKEETEIRLAETPKEEDIQNTRTKKTCLTDCKETVKKVLKARLKKDYEEDFYFTIGQAFDELEQIRGLVLDKQRFLFYKFVMSEAHFEPREQDLADLREAREEAKPHLGPMIP